MLIAFSHFLFFLIVLFIKYIVNAFYMPTIVLCVGDIVVNKIKSPDLMKITF